MRSQRARRDPRDPSCCTSAGTLPECDSGGRVRGRGVGRIQCTEQGLLQRWCGWCGWGGPSPGATAVLGSRREMGQSLSVGSPVVRGICRGPSACVTAPLTPSRSLPARSQLSASASGKNRAGRKKKWRRTDGNETVRCVKSQLNPTPASNLLCLFKTTMLEYSLLWFVDELSNTRWQHKPTIQERCQNSETCAPFQFYYSLIN